MTLTTLMAGVLTLVLVAGISGTAFAEVPNVIFDGGAPDQKNAWDATLWVRADSFVLDDDMVLTDVHFWVAEKGTWDGTIEWYLFEDDGLSVPPEGTPFAQGNGILIERVATGEIINNLPEYPEFEYWVNLDNPVPLEGGVKYWLGLHLSEDFDFDEIHWVTTSQAENIHHAYSEGGTFDNWKSQDNSLAFFLTGHPNQKVAGQTLPLDSAALLLAGLSSITPFMIPAMVGLVGAGIYLVKFRANKE